MSIENGYYHTAAGDVHFMSWFTDYGMEVFQPIPERKPVDTTGLVTASLEDTVKELVPVGVMMFAAKTSVHIQFDKQAPI